MSLSYPSSCGGSARAVRTGRAPPKEGSRGREILTPVVHPIARPMQERTYSRRDFLTAAHASAALVALPALTSCGGGGAEPAPPPPPAAGPPNILLIVTDDQRADWLGCYGHPIIRTPVIDSLAQRGTRFANTYVTTPICPASRASIYTGLYERTHGFVFGQPALAQRWVEQSFPQVLRRAGYKTAMIGKLDVSLTAESRAAMFDHLVSVDPVEFFHAQPDGSKIHESDLSAKHAIDWLGQQRKDQPFCLNLSFNAPHAQYSDITNLYPWPPSADRLYEGVTIPPARLADPAIYEALPDFLKRSFNRDQFFWCCDSPEKYQTTMRGHYRMISGIDTAVGRVLDELQRLGLADNTVVIYASDNGVYMGERGLAGKWSHFNEALRVPLIVMDPRAPAALRGRVETGYALNVDLAPTLLQLAGAAVPATMQGRSLVPQLRGGTDAGRETDFLCEHLYKHASIPQWQGLRGPRYAYARYFDDAPAYEFLHDLQTDPDELVNLATSPAHASVLASMRDRTNQLAGRYEAAKTA